MKDASLPSKSGDPIARTETMARILNISIQHIGRLRKEGAIPSPAAKGRWDVVQTVHAYLDHVRAGRKGSDDEGIKSEELRLLTVRREKTEEERDAQRLKNAVTRGETVSVADVEREWSSILRGVRARLMTVPSRVHNRAPHLTVQDVAAVDREMRDALTELGNDGAR